jgi:hypothetical protein
VSALLSVGDHTDAWLLAFKLPLVYAHDNLGKADAFSSRSLVPRSSLVLLVKPVRCFRVERGSADVLVRKPS